MINTYYATDVKVKPTSDKDIKVIRESEFQEILERIIDRIEFAEKEGIKLDYTSLKLRLYTEFDLKDCFGGEGWKK